MLGKLFSNSISLLTFSLDCSSGVLLGSDIQQSIEIYKLRSTRNVCHPTVLYMASFGLISLLHIPVIIHWNAYYNEFYSLCGLCILNWRICRSTVDSPPKGPVTWKAFWCYDLYQDLTFNSIYPHRTPVPKSRKICRGSTYKLHIYRTFILIKASFTKYCPSQWIAKQKKITKI